MGRQSKYSKFTDGALIPRPSMVHIAIVSSVLAVIVVGGIVIYRPFVHDESATTVQTKDSALAPCYDIMANVEWTHGLKLRSGGVSEVMSSRFGDLQYLSCAGYKGEDNFAFGATVRPDAFADLVASFDKNTLTPIPYEGTDLPATRSDSLEWSNGTLAVVSLRSDDGYEIRITDCCDVRPIKPAELNELANAINVYLTKNF